MKVRYSYVGCVVAVLVATSTARGQGIDIINQPLDGIEDLPADAPDEGEAVLPAAAPPAATAETVTIQASLPGIIKRTYDVKLVGDVDNDGRWGTYVDALFKYELVPGLVLVPELKVRGDNLSKAAMGPQGLKIEFLPRVTWTPQNLDKRLQLAASGSVLHTAVEGEDTTSLTVGASAAAFGCPLRQCADRDQLRVGASFTAPSAGSDSYKLDFAYALQWRYGVVPTPSEPGKVSPKRIATTPFASLKHTDAGWATSLGFDASVDLSLTVRIGAQLSRTLESDAQPMAATQGGMYLSYHAPSK